MAQSPDFREVLRPLTLLAIATEAVSEVTSARKKHGPSTDLADGTGSDQSVLYDLWWEGDLEIDADFESVLPTNHALEVAMQKVNDDRCANGRKHTRLGILLEEAFEAGSADSPEELRKELIQVIAMGIDWVADLDVRIALSA